MARKESQPNNLIRVGAPIVVGIGLVTSFAAAYENDNSNRTNVEQATHNLRIDNVGESQNWDDFTKDVFAQIDNLYKADPNTSRPQAPDNGHDLITIERGGSVWSAVQSKYGTDDLKTAGILDKNGIADMTMVYAGDKISVSKASVYGEPESGLAASVNVPESRSDIQALTITGCNDHDLKARVLNFTQDQSDDANMAEKSVHVLIENVSSDNNCPNIAVAETFVSDQDHPNTEAGWLESQDQMEERQQEFYVSAGESKEVWLSFPDNADCKDQKSYQMDFVKEGRSDREYTLGEVKTLPANKLYGSVMMEFAFYEDEDCKPTATPTNTATSTVTFTPTPTNTETRTVTPTNTPPPTETHRREKTKTPTSTATPIATETPVPSVTTVPVEQTPIPVPSIEPSLPLAGYGFSVKGKRNINEIAMYMAMLGTTSVAAGAFAGRFRRRFSLSANVLVNPLDRTLKIEGEEDDDEEQYRT